MSAVITGCGQWPGLKGGESFSRRIVTRRTTFVGPPPHNREYTFSTSDLPNLSQELGIRRVDQKALGTQFYAGCYAAGMTLRAAGVLGNENVSPAIGLSLAIKGCERDQKLDARIIEAAVASREYSGAETNHLLLEYLRPGLFLTQITNLLSANLSILYSLLGTSRTFVGEEQAGCSALEDAIRRATLSEPRACLAGSAFNADSDGVLSWFHSLGVLDESAEANVWLRSAGVLPASSAAFVLIEPEDCVRATGRPILASISMLLRSSWATKCNYASVLEEAWERIQSSCASDLVRTAIISNTHGASSTQVERAFWQSKAPHVGLVVGNAGLNGSALEVDVFSCINTAVTLLNSEPGSWPDITLARHPCQRHQALAPIDRAIIFCSGLVDGLSVYLVEKQ